MTARVACDVQVRFNQPPDELRRFFTTFYYVEVTVPDGGTVTDWLHPEWGNLRFHTGSMLKARTADGRELPKTDFAVTGPSSMAVQFTMGSARMWGIGFLPLGWAKFVPGSSGMFANALLDGHAHPAFASFASLAQTLFGREPDPPAELSRITNHFLACVDAPLPDEARIVAVHEALVDPETASVADLCARAGGNPRTPERLCHRAFGFGPKLLLRRQRFLRSLSHFMLDPSLRWIGAMDGQYHDQAQFVRDFRQFMGMTPSQYAALDKPILGAIMLARARFAGKAVQALDGPEGVSIVR